MTNTFLYRLFKNDKYLFAVVLTFILLQLFFTFKGVESFPFLNWGMYSGQNEKATQYSVYEIKVAEKKVAFSDLIDCKRSLISHSLSKYDELTSHNFVEKEEAVIEKRASIIGMESILKSRILNDSIQVKKYPYWLLQYLADMRMLQNPKIEINKKSVRYNNDASLEVIDNKTIGYYEYIQ